MFGVVDYCVVATMLIFSGVIGAYSFLKGNKSPEEFLMGNRSFKPLPVAMSLLTSYVSAMGILGYSGEIYAHGMQLAIFPFGAVLAIFFSSQFVLPILFPLKLTSINEFIELRFKSKSLRAVVVIIGLAKSLLFMGVSLYAPTIALVSVMNLSILTCILLLGILCTGYSSLGGIRAVIWTDVFQLGIMIIGCILVVAMGCAELGGLAEVLSISIEGGRFEMFNMTLSPFVRHTFINILLASIFAYGSVYCSEQTNLQRICAVKSLEDARIMLRYEICGMLLIHLLIFMGGLVAYATYFGCDPMTLGIIKRKEEILSYYINDKLSFIPGLHGIFVATLIGGTLSSFSSVINSSVAVIWKDVCLRYSFFKNSSSRKAMLTNKILSLIVGASLTGMAVVASHAHSLIEFSTSVMMPLIGPVFGIFIIAYFFPRCNLKGVWSGFILSSIINVWMSIGGMIYKRKPEMLPFSIEECENRNLTWANRSLVQNFTFSAINVPEKETSYNNSLLMDFYNVSYTFYSFLGPILCVVSAVIISYLTGNESIENVSPSHISPLVHRFYWKKETLKEISRNEKRLWNESIIFEGNKNGDMYEMINCGEKI